MTREEMWNAVETNDESYDGMFFYAVKSTGIYCRPSCKSKRPKQENVEYFSSSNEARTTGFRPCKRCRSDLMDYTPMKDIAEKTKKLLDDTFLAAGSFKDELNSLGVTKHRMNEIFKDQYGMTVSEYVNNLKLNEAKKRLLNSDETIIDIAYSVGFGSLSGFYRFFNENTGMTPAKYRNINTSIQKSL
jgi:AraC family transcriptional regulator, regulatory protein of adaptative response / methylphosphotriester-DNA alkyltransferase methyltransferase